MAAELFNWLVRATLAATVAVALVLLLRQPLRRMSGARVAYLGWLLVPLAMLAVALPAPSMRVQAGAHAAAVPTVHVGQALPVHAALVALDQASRREAAAWPAWVLAAWALGAAGCAGLFAWQQWRYRRLLGRLSARGDGLWMAEHAVSGPVVLGAWRPRIVLPADFEARYPPAQRALVIAHERRHVAVGDTRANVVVAALRCLQWFNPLLQLAFARAYRDDQELACDAAVLSAHPQARRAYADAMLNTQLAGGFGLPVGCQWRSSRFLKQRIALLKQPFPGRVRRHAGLGLLAMALAAGSYGAWALQPVVQDRAPAYLGALQHGVLARVDYQARMPKGGEDIEVSTSTVAQMDADGRQHTLMNSRDPLEVAIGTGQDQLRFSAQATDTVAAYPVIGWTLVRAGRVLDQGRIDLDGEPRTLSIGGPAHGTRSLVRLDFVRAGAAELIPQERKDSTRTAQAGTYAIELGPYYASVYPVRATATLLLRVGADGAVQHAQVQSIAPAGALSERLALDAVEAMAFAPTVRDGHAVASLVRATVHLAPLAQLSAGLGHAVPAPASREAQAVDKTPPHYPERAARAGVGGQVLLLVDVDAQGKASRVRVQRSAPAGVFDQAALAAARQWTFKPALKDGRPVASTVRVPVTFEVAPEERPSVDGNTPPGALAAHQAGGCGRDAASGPGVSQAGCAAAGADL